MPVRRNNTGGSDAYAVVQEFASQSKPGKKYTVKRKVATGELSCDCPVWIFSGRNRHCSHIDRVREIESSGNASSSARPASRAATRVSRIAPPPDGYRRVGSIGGYNIYRRGSDAPADFFCGCAAFQRDRECQHVEGAARSRLGEFIPTSYRSEFVQRIEGNAISLVVEGVLTYRNGVTVNTGKYYCACDVFERGGDCLHLRQFQEELEERSRRAREEQTARERADAIRAQTDRMRTAGEEIRHGFDFVLRRLREGEEDLVVSWSEQRGRMVALVTVSAGEYYCSCDAFRRFGDCPHASVQRDTDRVFGGDGSNRSDIGTQSEQGRESGASQRQNTVGAVGRASERGEDNSEVERWRSSRTGGIEFVSEDE